MCFHCTGGSCDAEIMRCGVTGCDLFESLTTELFFLVTGVTIIIMLLYVFVCDTLYL